MPSYLCWAKQSGLSGRCAGVAALLCHAAVLYWAVMVLLWLLKAARAPGCAAASVCSWLCLLVAVPLQLLSSSAAAAPPDCAAVADKSQFLRLC